MDVTENSSLKCISSSSLSYLQFHFFQGFLSFITSVFSHYLLLGVSVSPPSFFIFASYTSSLPLSSPHIPKSNFPSFHCSSHTFLSISTHVLFHFSLFPILPFSCSFLKFFLSYLFPSPSLLIPPSFKSVTHSFLLKNQFYPAKLPHTFLLLVTLLSASFCDQI